MKKPEVGAERNPAGERFLTVTCPDCGTTNRYPFAGLQPGLRLECSCGVGFNFSQENYDALEKQFGLGEEGGEVTH